MKFSIFYCIPNLNHFIQIILKTPLHEAHFFFPWQSYKVLKEKARERRGSNVTGATFRSLRDCLMPFICFLLVPIDFLDCAARLKGQQFIINLAFQFYCTVLSWVIVTVTRQCERAKGCGNLSTCLDFSVM